MTIVHQLLSSATTCCRFIVLQNRTVCAGTCLPCAQFTSAYRFEKVPQKVGVCCAYTTSQRKVLQIKSEPKLYPLKIHADGPGTFSPFIFHPKLGIEFSNSAMQRNIFSSGSIGLLDYYCFASISKRSFSKAPGALANKSDSFGVKDGGKRKSSFRFQNIRKRVNTIDACRRNTASSQTFGKNASECGVSATKGNDMINSKDQLHADDKMDAKLDLLSPFDGNDMQKPKAKGKTKRQSKNKGSKGQLSDANAASDEVNQQKISRRAPKSKKPSLSENKPSGVGSEINPTQASECNILANDHPKAKTNKSKRKQKTNKEASAVVKTDAAMTDSSASKLSQSLRSDMSSKTMPKGRTKFLQLYPPTAKSVVVVESLTKAKIIQGYLGDMYEVLPSYGHVRDLAARSGSVRPDDEFSMVWEVPSAAWTHLKSIKVALSGAKNLILASDPDREGEAIAWHILEMLQQQDALHDHVTVARVVFNEITEFSIKSALQSPREIDVNLVHAYLARRALDYLIGFNISPLLWRKLPGCRSAGRVQSAALSLICDREKEIDKFKPQEYWTVEVEFRIGNLSSAGVLSFPSYLAHMEGQKLNQLSISSQAEANNIERYIKSSTFEVVASKKSKSRRNPPAPYITSSLQQDAANKLNFTAAYTMKLAQKLYEGIQLSDGQAIGLITYMRTDGLHISDDAAKDIQSFIMERYGQNFASRTGRKYFKKVKNAQEAHEAIRPTNIRRLPSLLSRELDEDSLKLYTLIWSRTVACQMEPASIDHIQLDIGNSIKSIVFHSSSSRVEFLGYQAVFKDRESAVITLDDTGNNLSEVFEVLCSLETGDLLDLGKVELAQHHTRPPARYSEGALIKKLEELGIGRPSTYASTIKVLKDRNYVTVKSRILYPEFRGRMVSAFLSNYFSEVTDYSFTADMETELDNVSAGLTEWKGLLSDYWTRFHKYCECASNLHIHLVEKMLEKTFGDFLFASLPSRTCPSCSEGTLIFKVSRFRAGYFIGCDQHPKCKYVAKTLYGEDDDEDDDVNSDKKNRNVEPPKLLGLNPVSNEKVLLKNGPYGFYVQLGEDRPGFLPKRASISQIKGVDTITLEDALDLLRYPVILGKHPDDSFPVMIMNKKGGFAIKHRRTRAPVPKNMKPGDITLEKALKLLLSKDATRSGRPKSKPKGGDSSSSPEGEDSSSSPEGEDSSSSLARSRRPKSKPEVEDSSSSPEVEDSSSLPEGEDSSSSLARSGRPKSSPEVEDSSSSLANH